MKDLFKSLGIEFRFDQGANLFSFVLGIYLILLALIGISYLPSSKPSQSSASISLPTYENTSATPIATTMPQGLTPDQFRDGHWHEPCITTTTPITCGIGKWDASKNAFHMLDGSPDIQYSKSLVVYPHVDETELVVNTTYWECPLPQYALIANKKQLTSCFIGTYTGKDADGYHFVTLQGVQMDLPWTHGGFIYIQP